MKSALSFKPTALFAAVCSAATAGAAGAADLPKEGKYDYTACYAGTISVIAFSKTHRGLGYEFTGTSQSNPPGGIFDKTSYHCVGSAAEFDKKYSGMVTCQERDHDGDSLLTHFRAGDDRQWIRQTIAGTGKYEGIVTKGTFAALGPFPIAKPGTFQNCVRQAGTYTLKK
jgi:hypothetical protein